MHRTSVVLAIVALVVTACGGVDEISEGIAERALESAGEGDVDVDFSTDEDGFSASVETDEGSFAIGGAAEVPAGLEMPVPDGGNATASGTDASSIFVSLVYPGDRYDEIVATYESWTASNGEEWQKSTGTFDVGGDREACSIGMAPTWEASNSEVRRGSPDQRQSSSPTASTSRAEAPRSTPSA